MLQALGVRGLVCLAQPAAGRPNRNTPRRPSLRTNAGAAGRRNARQGSVRAQGDEGGVRAPTAPSRDREAGQGSNSDDDDDKFEGPIKHAHPLGNLDYHSIGAAAAPPAPSVADQVPQIERIAWSKVKRKLRPTQAALGWDWVFYKLGNFTSESEAQHYMAQKPVPYVQRGDRKYIVDHHHTLVALELSGYDPEITLEQVRSFDKNEQSIEAFWGYMEGRGWSFLRDENYARIDPSTVPKDFEITNFRNDVYRSIGGFLRVYDVLKRGKTLEDTLFFEFRWGYFVWLHRNNNYGLWPDAVIHRSFQRAVSLLQTIDEEEYQEFARKGSWPVAELTYISREVTEPAYQMLCYYVRYLCIQYDSLPKAKKDVPGLMEIFGADHNILPGKVISS